MALIKFVKVVDSGLLTADPLYAYSIIYLVLPVLLFVSFWLRPPLAATAVLGIMVALFLALTRGPRRPHHKDAGRNGLYVVVSACLISAWGVIGGIGGIMAQTQDYNKHNAVLADLVHFPWPVIYPSGHLLTYYIGYYLPVTLPIY